jgi:glycosyltransferase involved in cell wall biosynthesis
MRIAVLLDHRWESGVKTFSIGALFSFLKLKELLKSSLGDTEIDFYVMTFSPNDNVEYFKVDFNELYELYKEGDIKKIIELANKENYASISKQIRLDDILEGLSNSDFVFITNVGFAVYNNSLDKEDLDKILSNNRKGIYMLMFHTDYAGNFLYNLVEFINSGKLKSISETTKNKIYSLLHKKIERGYMTDEDQRELMRIIEYLSNSNTEEAIEFRNKYGWWLNEVKKYMHTFGKLTRLKNVINLFPTHIVSDSNSRFIKNATGSNIKKGEVLHEPMFMILLDKYYKNEIKVYKNAYLEKHYKDNKINLLYVGRNSKEKGIDDLIRLFEDLVKEGEDIRLIIVSPDFGKDTEEYKRLEEIVSKYRRGEVHIYSKALGNSLHEYPLYYIALLKALGEKPTIYINPAYTESYGLSTLEVLIFGKLLVIYRDVDGLSELKDEGYLNYKTAFRTYEDLVNLTKKIIEEIKEDIKNGRYDKIENEKNRKGNYDKYVNREKIGELEKEVDPEELAEKYKEIIYLAKGHEKIMHNKSESKYNNNLEAQSEEITAEAA